MLETALTILKYSSLVLAAISSIWGVTHELYTKDENNKRHLTSAGKYAITFTVVSLLVSLNTTVLESITKQRKEQQAAASAAQKDSERNLKLLQEISRAVYPLNDVEIGFTLSLPLDDERLAQYKTRLRNGAERYADTLSKAKSRASKLTRTKDIEAGSYSWAVNGLRVSTVYIRKDSTFLPQIEDGYTFTNESLAYGLMRSGNAGGLYLSLSKSTDQLAKFNIENVFRQSDLLWTASFAQGEPILIYDLKSETATLSYNVKLTKDDWSTNKPINSLTDLLGMTMFVYLNPSPFFLNKEQDAVLNHLRKNTTLENLSIRMGNHTFGFDKDNLVENRTTDDYPYNTYKLPETLDALFSEQYKRETQSQGD